MYETLFSRPPTENPSCLRPTARLTAGPGHPIRCQPRVPGAVAAATAHHWGDRAAPPRGRPPTALRPSRPGPGAPVSPRAAGCHTGRALYPAPAAARAADQLGHHVPHAATSRATA